MEEFLFNYRVGKDFSCLTPNPETIKEKIDKFDYMKTKKEITWFYGKEHHK